MQPTLHPPLSGTLTHTHTDESQDMMMSDHKKVAMLIVKGLSSPERQAKANDMEQGVKTESEHDDYNSSMGPESAMKDFFAACKAEDAPKACKAMKLFMEMSNGTEMVEEESEGGDPKNPHGY